MMTGVTKGFLYRCKCAYNHFGFGVSQEGNTIEIRKFAGESRVRVLKLRDGVTIVRPDNKDEKDDILISGNDIDAVSQTAADLNTCAVIRNKDLRRFLDGIFVSSRGHVVEE
uniref:Large ribosomal subunit protein uL6 n=1 Tax=Lygus hesperus TaxID=30085 RepID=A0A0A9XET4_LYGHE